jgi:hypothetical protein
MILQAAMKFVEGDLAICPATDQIGDLWLVHTDLDLLSHSPPAT